MRSRALDSLGPGEALEMLLWRSWWDLTPGLVHQDKSLSSQLPREHEAGLLFHPGHNAGHRACAYKWAVFIALGRREAMVAFGAAFK